MQKPDCGDPGTRLLQTCDGASPDWDSSPTTSPPSWPKREALSTQSRQTISHTPKRELRYSRVSSTFPGTMEAMSSSQRMIAWISSTSLTPTPYTSTPLNSCSLKANMYSLRSPPPCQEKTPDGWSNTPKIMLRYHTTCWSFDVLTESVLHHQLLDQTLPRLQVFPCKA